MPPPPVRPGLTWFRAPAQAGTVGAQLAIYDSASGATATLYGTFDAGGAPAKLRYIVTARPASDTVGVLQLDDAGQPILTYMFSRTSGQRLPYLARLTQVGDTGLTVAVYAADGRTAPKRLTTTFVSRDASGALKAQLAYVDPDLLLSMAPRAAEASAGSAFGAAYLPGPGSSITNRDAPAALRFQQGQGDT